MKTRPGPRTDKDLIEAIASRDFQVSHGAVVELGEWLREHPEGALERAERIGSLALKPAHSGSRRKLGCVILPTLAAAGAALPAKWDPLVTAYGDAEQHRSVLAKIPIARRTAIFDREIRSGDENAIFRLAECHLDLAPEATKTMLEHFAARGELRARLNWFQLKKWTRRAPRVAAILKTYVARAKKEAPPRSAPKPEGTLSFTDCAVVNPGDFRKLDAIARAQYCHAAEAYAGGGKIRDANAFIARLRNMDLDADDASMRRWRVQQQGKHLYDLWVVWVDNGSVFFANTARRVPVHQIQDDFKPLDKRPASKLLADDFNASKPRDLWSASPTKSVS